MLTLYHSPQTRSSRIIWLLEEIGEPYDLEYVGIRRYDGTGGRDPKNPHPEGKVPALVHDGRLVRETAAICLYLTDAFPNAGIGPKAGDAQRADYLFWLFNLAGDLDPAMRARMSGSGDNPIWKNAYDECMARLTNTLNANDYLLGKFSAADILFWGTLRYARKEFPADAVFDRYFERCAARPANQRAAAKDKQ